MIRVFLLSLMCLVLRQVNCQTIVDPSGFPQETNPNNSNFEFYSKKGGPNKRATFSNVRKNMAPFISAIAFTPSETGNTTNFGEFVIDPSDAAWYIDYNGNSIPIPYVSPFTAGTGISISGAHVITNTGDLSATNEIQTLSLAGSTLSLSIGGGSVTLPTPATYTAGAGISIAGNVVTNTGDLSKTNEGSLSVSPGTDSTAQISSNTMSSTPVTLKVRGLEIEESGNTITLTGNGTIYTPGTGIAISGGGVISNTGDTNASDDITTSTAAAGDVSGTFPTLTVVGIRGVGVSATAPTSNQILKYNGSVWAPATDEVGGGGGSGANLDYSGTSGTITLRSDTGTDVTFVPGTGVSFAATSSALTVTNTGDTDASNDLTTSTSFAGDLTGFYNALDLGTGVVGTNEIATDGVGSAEIAADAVGASEIAAGAVGSSELASTAVTAATYGSATQVPVFTVDADGRLTSVTNTTITGTGGITGTLANGRVTLSSGTSTVTDDDDLKFNGTQLSVGTGTAAGSINLFPAASTGTAQFIQATANTTGSAYSFIRNLDNTAGGNILTLGVGGTSAGDPRITYSIPGGTYGWEMGVDNSEQTFKIASDVIGVSQATDNFILSGDGRASIGGALLQTGVNLTVGGTGSITVPIGTTAQQPGNTFANLRYNSDVTGWETSSPTGNWHRLSSGQAPTVAIQTGAGTGASATLVSGSNDIDGIVTINMGSGPSSGGVLARVTFGDGYSASSRVFVQLRGVNDAASAISILPSSVSSTIFNIKMPTGATAPASPAVLQFTYHVSN